MPTFTVAVLDILFSHILLALTLNDASFQRLALRAFLIRLALVSILFLPNLLHSTMPLSYSATSSAPPCPRLIPLPPFLPFLLLFPHHLRSALPSSPSNRKKLQKARKAPTTRGGLGRRTHNTVTQCRNQIARASSVGVGAFW